MEPAACAPSSSFRVLLKGVQMSCMIDAQDGMVVSTTDPEAMEFRRFVIECLMLNHPHDCPVCDEGGQCILQEETISGGHGVRRYLGRKRTYRDQYLGKFIAHEMNRCITAIGVRGSTRTLRDTGTSAPCSRPTVFTSEGSPTGRWKARFPETSWISAPLACTRIDRLVSRPAAGTWNDRPPYASIAPLAAISLEMPGYREMVRVEGRYNGAVNGYFICDRGRFGFAYANREDRPRVARVDGKPTPIAEAVRTAAERLKRVTLAAGHDAVACLGSPRSSIETQYALKRLCRQQIWRDPSYFVKAEDELKAKRAVSLLRSSSPISMKEIEEADFVLAVGVDPVNEAPMLALAMRQAFRKGARVTVVDPRPVSLPFAFDHIPVRTGEMEEFIYLTGQVGNGQGGCRLPPE